MNSFARIISPACFARCGHIGSRQRARAGAIGRYQLLPDQQRHRQWRQSRRARRRRQSLPDIGAGGRSGRQDLARLPLDAGRRRSACRQCARSHRQGTVEECQGRGGRQGRRRSARRQQPHQADRAQREGRGHQRPRRYAQPPRRADGIAAGRVTRLRPARIAPARTGRAPRKARRWSAIPTASACATTTPRSPGTRRIPRAARTAAARRPTSRAPAATGCCIASRRTDEQMN